MKSKCVISMADDRLDFRDRFCFGNYALASGIQRLPSGVGGFGFALLGNGNSE